MAHLPMDDVKELWQEMGGSKSWDSLNSTLKSHRNKSRGIDDNMVDRLIEISGNMKGKQFPDSPEKLSKELNQRVGEVD